MPTTASNSGGLNSRELSSARKLMLLHHTIALDIWERANSRQKQTLHQIELLAKSLSPEDIKELKAHNKQ